MPYSIKEISKMTGLPASTLRYYDKQGLLPSLKRNANNVRIFEDEDCRVLKLIDCLKRSGLSIKEIKEFIDAAEQGDKSLKTRLRIFKKRRDFLNRELEDLQEVLSVMEYKCWYYETACAAGTEDILKNLQTSDIPEKFRAVREKLFANF